MKAPRKETLKPVSASELAQMGVCERLVVFEHRFGKRFSKERRQAIRRGLDEHDRFYQDGIDASANRGRCYIATLVFGESQETATLRLFREQVLRPFGVGRWVIKLYYQTAPTICRLLVRRPILQRFVRLILRPLVWIVALWISNSRG
jgi:hypothetical protein